MSLFSCSGCEARDAEISRLVQEKRDLVNALLIAKGYHELAELPDPGPEMPGEAEEVKEILSDEQWAERELELKRMEVVARGGQVRADFPV